MNPALKGLGRILTNLHALPKINAIESNLTNKIKFPALQRPKLTNNINAKKGRIEPQAETGEKTLPKRIARNFKKGPKFFSGPVL
jgi:hypothetical protein